MESSPDRCWQVQCKSMTERFSCLLSGYFSDCVFEVGLKPELVYVVAHKLILAAASPVFETMFYRDLINGRNPPIPILDIRIEVFNLFLKYIYTDEIRISSFNVACELCYAGRTYMLPYLVHECKRYLWANVTPETACRGYEFAVKIQDDALKELCLQEIRMNTMEVLADSSFVEVDLSTVVEVFSLEHMNVRSELDLFAALARYAQARGQELPWRTPSPGSDRSSSSDEKPMDLSCKPEPEPYQANPEAQHANPEAQHANPEAQHANPEAQRANAELHRDEAEPGPSGYNASLFAETHETLTIRSAIKKIRFLTMSSQEFVEGPAQSPLLTSSEIYAVCTQIVSKGSTDVPLPAGFSASRQPREPPISVRSVPNITMTFISYINELFIARNMFKWVSDPFRCSHCNRYGMMMKSSFATHYVCYCLGFNLQRFEYETVCSAFNIKPYCMNIRKNKYAVAALHFFIDYIQEQTKNVKY